MVAAIWISAAIAAFGAIDVGNFFLVRRQLQQSADLAAVAAAETIGSAGGCTAATASAQDSATANGLPTSGKVDVLCGRWDPTANPTSPYFSTTGTPMNAAKVTVNQAVPYFFMVGPARTLSATATAKATNIRSFSIATSVATLSGGAINGLLNGLLHTSLNLSAVSYQGLASTQVKLGDLALALGAGSIAELLTTQVTVGQLAAALQVAANQGNTLSATLSTALGTIVAAIPPGAKISVGSMLSVGLGDPQAAVSATVTVLDALMVAAEVANGQSAIDLGVALNLGPIANISAQAMVTQPPVIAVGEAGQNPDGTWRASAHAAQVRLFLNLQLVNTQVGGTSILSSIVKITLLNLPIYIEVGPGTAYLSSTQCSTQRATSYSQIVASTGATAICIGGDASSNLTNTTNPTQCNQPAAITTVNALGLNLVNISAGTTSPPSGVNLALQNSKSTTFTFNGVVGDSDDYQTTNTNGLGSATGGLLAQLAGSLGTSLHASLLGLDVTALLLPVITAIVGLLTPILNSLDAILIPLLQLLGVQIGVSTVHDLGLACGQAQLVN